MPVDHDELEVAREAVQALLDKYVPTMFRSMVPAEAAHDIARAALQAVQDKRDGKII